MRKFLIYGRCVLSLFSRSLSSCVPKVLGMDTDTQVGGDFHVDFMDY